MADDQFMQSALEALDKAIARVAKAEFDRLRDGLETPAVACKIHDALCSMSRLRSDRQPDYDEWDSLFYISWYQPRQVHLAYAILRELHKGKSVHGLRVVDVGCGAGAVQMAAALMAAESLRDLSDCDIAVDGIEPGRAMRRLGEELWIEWWQLADDCSSLERLAAALDAMSSSCETFDSDGTWACSARDRPARRFADSRWWLTAVHAVYKEGRENITCLCRRVLKCLDEGSCGVACVVFTSDDSKKTHVDEMGALQGLVWNASESG